MVSRPGYSLNEGNDNNYCWLCKQHLEQHNTKYTMDPLGIRGRTAGCGKAACADALTIGIEDNYVCLCGQGSIRTCHNGYCTRCIPLFTADIDRHDKSLECI